jgi:mannose/fructose/N-acetylgalactosamine-specific phosphotransferase system component IIB
LEVISISEFGLIRIDDRLIHGQVIAVWCRQRNFKRIIILDDGVAADKFMQQVLRLAAPPGLEVGAFAIEPSIEMLDALPNKESVMLLMKTPKSAKKLYDAGLQYKELNIGGIGMGPGRKSVFKNTAMSDEEITILKDLNGKGVKITLLSVPGEKSKAFTDLI